MKEKKIREENVSLESSVIINFIIKCVNPIIVNGIMEVITSQSDDPIDDLVKSTTYLLIIKLTYFIYILGRIHLQS